MLLSALHRHEAVGSVAVGCEACAHHVHHAGHLTAGADSHEACLLCQFLSLSYVMAAVIITLLPICFTIVVRSRELLFFSSYGGNHQSSRAPPLTFD